MITLAHKVFLFALTINGMEDNLSFGLTSISISTHPLNNLHQISDISEPRVEIRNRWIWLNCWGITGPFHLFTQGKLTDQFIHQCGVRQMLLAISRHQKAGKVLLSLIGFTSLTCCSWQRMSISGRPYRKRNCSITTRTLSGYMSNDLTLSRASPFNAFGGEHNFRNYYNYKQQLNYQRLLKT